ncbi:MAG: hypothetical protein CMF70_11145 [Magnetovibrio sp.]|nr:hypothetical protein [Magnetovibrio sp.]
MVTTIIAITVLLVLSAFFSGSETALTAASRPVMHQMESSGEPRAAIVNALHQNKDRLIGALLLGNNLINILASALATSILIQMFGEAGVLYATLAMTLLILVFAEVLPKTYMIRNANRMALTVAPAVKIVVLILGPITQSITLIVNIVLQMLGARKSPNSATDENEEELRGAIELHSGEKNGTRQEKAMLRSVLDLSDVWVGEIMVHRKSVNTIDANQPAISILDETLDSPFTRLPIWKDNPDNIIGVLHAKALFRELKEKEHDTSNVDLTAVATKPWFIPEQTDLLEQLEAFQQRREHFAFVVDEYGTWMGIVTLEDIIEEIVGAIEDEHDIYVSSFAPQPDGSYLVNGAVTIRDLNRACDWSLPDDQAATIAGLVQHESRRIPEVGQSFIFHNFRFDILKRQRNQITSIRITPQFINKKEVN